MTQIKVGDSLPSVNLYDGAPNVVVNLAEDLKNKKKAIIFGVPGAFTPGCSKTHLPGYIKDFEKLTKEKGVDYVGCLSVNDAFVMKAWGDATGVAENTIHMLADPTAEFVKAAGLDFNHAVLGGARSKRFSMVVQEGKVTALEVEPDNGGLTCSLVNEIYKHL